MKKAMTVVGIWVITAVFAVGLMKFLEQAPGTMAASSFAPKISPFGGTVYQWEDEFVDSGVTTGANNPWNVTLNSGQWAAGTVVGHQGVKSFSTLASASSAPVIYLYQNAFTFGTDATECGWLIQTPSALSDGTDSYMIMAGFGDSTTSALSVDAAYIIYRHDINSGRWQGVTSNNSTTNAMTAANNVTVVINTWYYLQTKVNAAGTLVEFYVNGTLIGTSAAQIPTGASRALTMFCGLTKYLGTNARTVAVDECGYRIVYTTPRFYN